MRMIAGALALLLGMLAAGCDGEGVTGTRRPARLLVLSGDQQTDTVGRELAEPLVVRVVDDEDRPVKNQRVNFVVTAGGGSVLAGSALTNAVGEARERWTLGPVAGDTQRVEARAVDATGGQAIVLSALRAAGVSDAPASAVILGGGVRAGSVGSSVSDSLVVRVTDRHGNPVSGVTVAFAAQNGGAISPATAVTRADGTARSQWTLGPVAGPQAATASAGGSAPMTFTAQAATGTVTRVVLLPDSIRWATLGRKQALVVQAYDGFGNLVGGQTATLISQNDSVAALEPGSIARAAGNGTTRIIATVAGSTAADTLPVTVRQVPLEIMAYLGWQQDSSAVAVGRTIIIQALIRDSSLANVPRNLVSWTSRRGRVSLDSIGIATGVSAGLDTVDVSGGTATDFVVLSVRAELRGTRVSRQPCALDLQGAAYCWGDNSGGTVGTGVVGGPDPCRKTNYLQPTQCYVAAQRVAGGHVFAQLAEGGPCALTPAGAAYCWGGNRQGQLGTGDTIQSLVPTAVSGGHTFVQIDAGGRSACGLTSAGDLYCWGEINGAGQATQDPVANSVPRRVPGGLKFASFSVSAQVCALTPAGQAYCWGRSADGELGDGTRTDRAEPTPVSGDITFARISAGARATCGLRTDGAAFCWGRNDGGSLGLGHYTQDVYPTPMPVAGGIAFQSISQSGYRACALTASGSAYCWGVLMMSTSGMVTAASNAPAAVPGGFSFRQVATSSASTCGVATDGRIRCWGYNFFGTLGDGTVDDSLVPVQVLTR